MKVHMKPLTLIAVFFLLVGSSLHAQVTNAEAESYFKQFMDRSQQAIEFSSIVATKKQLKKVFKRKDVKKVSAFYGEQMEEAKDPGSKNYAQVRIVNFSSEELKEGTKKSTPGMNKIADRVKPGVIFYQVTYYKRPDAKLGLSYKYFIRVKDEWVFLPKPWRAFK